MNAIKNWTSGRRERSLLVILALAGTLITTLAVTNLLLGEPEPIKESSSEGLAETQEQIKQWIQRAEVAHFDETGMASEKR